MKIKLILVLLILLASPLMNLGQQPDSIMKSTHLLFGLNRNNIKETSLNRLIHRGTGGVLGLKFQSENNRRISELLVTLGGNFLKSKYESEISSYNFNTSFEYHHLFNLSTSEQLKIHAGGAMLFNANVEYFDNWNENHFYWFTSYALAIDLRIIIPIAQQKQFQLECKLPIISAVSRPPKEFAYTQANNGFFNVISKMHEHMHISFPDQYFDVGLLCRYVFKPGNGIRPAVFWQSRYKNVSLPGSGGLSSIMHTVGFEIHFLSTRSSKHGSKGKRKK